MRRFSALLVLMLPLACALPQVPEAEIAQATSFETGQSERACRVGAEGGPLVREPKAAQVAEPKVADRGIGGTGAPQVVSQRAERGIGGTGIVGVITGFASICVNGLEVAYDSSTAVDIEGTSGTTSALRVGQIVAIQAQGSPASPIARTISVRRQVTGRIEAIEPGSGKLSIAGQPVSVPIGTPGAHSIRLGAWVAVSGLRCADGQLIASRLDPANPGTLAVRGQVVRDGDTARIGQLVLDGVAAANLKDGQYIMVSGQYAAGQVQIRAVTQDLLSSDPAAYFGTVVNHLVLQAYVHVANGAVYLNGLKAAAGPGVSGKTDTDGVAIVSLERAASGSFTVVGLRYTDHAGETSGGIDTPAEKPIVEPESPPQAVRSGSPTIPVGGRGGSSFSQQAVAAAGNVAGPAMSSSARGSAMIGPEVTTPPSMPRGLPASMTAPEPNSESVDLPSPATASPLVKPEGVAPDSRLISSVSPRAPKGSKLAHTAVPRNIAPSSTSASTVSLATAATPVSQSPSGSATIATGAVSSPGESSSIKPISTAFCRRKPAARPLGRGPCPPDKPLQKHPTVPCCRTD